MHRRSVQLGLTATLLAAALTATSLAPATSADADRARGGPPTGLRGAVASAAASAPVDCYRTTGLSGFATDADGDPVADAPVMLHGETTPAHLKVGDVVRPRLIGWTRTDAAGCYSVPLSASRALLASADRYGVVNLRVTLQRPDALEVVNVSRVLTRAAGGRLSLRPVGAEASVLHADRLRVGGAVIGSIQQSFGEQADALRAAGRQAEETTEQTLTMEGHTGVASVTPGTVSSAARHLLGGAVPARAVAEAGMQPDVEPLTASGGRPQMKPHSTLLKVFHKHVVLVGQWWSRMSGVSQDWAYAQGATSNLQSAFSVSGGPGTYTHSQTYAQSTDATIGFPTSKNQIGIYYRTYFRYAKWLNWSCDVYVGCHDVSVTIKPYTWERGVDYVKGIPVPIVQKHNCTLYRKGGKDSSGGSKAITWSDGVLVTGDLLKGLGAGVSLSAQTGFNSRAENRVHFHRAGHLCGLFSRLSSNPGALVARRF